MLREVFTGHNHNNLNKPHHPHPHPHTHTTPAPLAGKRRCPRAALVARRLRARKRLVRHAAPTHVRRVLGGDLAQLVARHLSLPEVLSLARCSGAIRKAVFANALPHITHAKLCSSPRGGSAASPCQGGCEGASVLHLPNTDLASFLRGVPLVGLTHLEVDCHSTAFFSGFAAAGAHPSGSSPPALCFSPLVLSLTLHLPHAANDHGNDENDDEGGMPARAAEVLGLEDFPGLCNFLGLIAGSATRLSIQTVNFALAATFLSGLPNMPQLQCLELGELLCLPPVGLLTDIFRNLPALKCLELDRYEAPGVADDHVFGTTLVRALHASLCDLAELAVVGAWLDVHDLVAKVLPLINVSWYSPENDGVEGGDDELVDFVPVAAGHHHHHQPQQLQLSRSHEEEEEEGEEEDNEEGVEAEGERVHDDEDGEEDDELESSQLLSLRVFASNSTVLRSEHSLVALSRTCPHLTHLHVEDLPLVLPQARRLHADHAMPFWCGLTAVRALHAFPCLGELEIGLEWPYPISPEESLELAEEVAASLAHLVSRASDLQTVQVLLQRYPCVPELSLADVAKVLEQRTLALCNARAPGRGLQLSCQIC